MAIPPSYLPARPRLAAQPTVVVEVPRRIGVLRRWSTPRQGDSARVGLQFSDMFGVVSAQGWEPVPYDDGQVSGRKSVSARKAAAQMLYDLETNAIQGVAAIELSRIAREPSGLDLAKFVHALLQQDAPLILADEMLWPANPQHRMKIEMLRMYASWEWDTIRSRMWKPNVIRRVGTERITNAGLPPIGYRWRLNGIRRNGTPDRELEQDPEFALTVREIFRHAGQSPSLLATARHLNATGMLCRTRDWGTRPWTSSDVNLVLRNPLYSGRLVPFRYSQENRYVEKLILDVAGDRVDPKTGHIVIPCPQLAYVSPETQDAIVTLLERRKVVPKAARRVDASPLSGLLRCAQCGGAMRSTSVSSPKGSQRTPNERYFGCRAKYDMSHECPGQRYPDSSALRAVYVFIQGEFTKEIEERIGRDAATRQSAGAQREVDQFRRMLQQLGEQQETVMGYLLQFKDQPGLVQKWSEKLRQTEREIKDVQRQLDDALSVSQIPDILVAASRLRDVFPDYMCSLERTQQRALLIALFTELRLATRGWGKKREVEVVYARLCVGEPVTRKPSWELCTDEQTSGRFGIITLLAERIRDFVA